MLWLVLCDVASCLALGTDSVTGKNYDRRKVWIERIGHCDTNQPGRSQCRRSCTCGIIICHRDLAKEHRGSVSPYIWGSVLLRVSVVQIVRVVIVELNEITGQIIDASIKVHRCLGPGLLESAYEAVLAYELRKRGLHVDTQLPLPVTYEEVNLEVGYRIDLFVEHDVIVELKAVEKMIPLYDAQLLTYLKLRKKKIGLLINFNVVLLKDGIKRLAN